MVLWSYYSPYSDGMLRGINQNSWLHDGGKGWFALLLF
jgi:hypothetical protein